MNLSENVSNLLLYIPTLKFPVYILKSLVDIVTRIFGRYTGFLNLARYLYWNFWVYMYIEMLSGTLKLWINVSKFLMDVLKSLVDTLIFIDIHIGYSKILCGCMKFLVNILKPSVDALIFTVDALQFSVGIGNS